MSAPTSIITVTIAPDFVGLVSRERAKQELGITEDSFDTLLDGWITEESGTVTEYIDRDLALSTLSVEFSVTSQAMSLDLPLRPIVEIASVTEGGVVLTGADYERDDARGKLYRLLNGARIEWCHSTVTVVYQGGYALPDSAPSWAVKATVACLTHRWAAKGRDPALKELNIPGVVDEQYWVGTIGSGGALPPGVEDLLAPHRDIWA